jgi:protein-tyrosine phosphatase
VIDLHTHVLPGIDDGPRDTAGAIALAARAAADGVRVLAATPHVRADHPDVRPQELGERAEQLRHALRAARVDVEIVAGGEVDIFWAQSATPDDLQRVSYGQRGTDLLVETPYGALSDRFEQLLFQLRAGGLRLLLAHPERSPAFRREPKRLGELVRQGVLLQVTASTLASPKRRTHAFARRLVREGLAHVIASDSHGAAIDRAALSAGVAALAQVAPSRARWMVTEAPAAILAGAPLPPPPSDRAPLRHRPRWPRG